MLMPLRCFTPPIFAAMLPDTAMLIFYADFRRHARLLMLPS